MDKFSSPREGQIPDRFRQVWTGFRKNLPEPVHVPYVTKPGPNLTEDWGLFGRGEGSQLNELSVGPKGPPGIHNTRPSLAETSRYDAAREGLVLDNSQNEGR